MDTPLLDVRNLSVKFPRRDSALTAVDDISFSLPRGGRLGLVGESGAGKSITGFSILNLVPNPGFIAGGDVLFDGKNLTGMGQKDLRRIRGDRISMIFQDPMMTLNPVLTIGTQMIETLQAHRNIGKADAAALAVECLRKVYIPSPERRLEQYPHELSGGMRQRVVIAIALLTDPDLIIADEPTTALDVTIQAEIMELLVELCTQNTMGLILITHDLGVVSQVTHSMAVMYAGRIVEEGPTVEVIKEPLHPYTQGLLAALPQSVQEGHRLNQIPGVMPSLAAVPSGCSFHPRCHKAEAVCREQKPELRCNSMCAGRRVACHLA